jgi:predicted negative regulator of RcsB-dependent stress response
MSMELMDEHEQGERVRAWLRENGASIVTGIAIGIALIGGWQWWKTQQAHRAVESSTQYVALTSAIEGGDRDLAEQLVKALREDYASTPYATLAALAWADQQLDAGELQAAVSTLQQARTESKDPLLADLVTVRLARAQIAAGQAEAALALVEGAQRGSALDVKGDALLALGRSDQAIAAYQAALGELDENLPSRRLIELKLLDLGVARTDEAQG